MAIRFDAGTDVIVVPGWTGNVWSVLFWVSRVADRNTFSNPWVVRTNANGTGTQLGGLGSNSGGDILTTFDSAFANQTGPTMTNGTWYCIGLVGNNTSWTLYHGTNPASLTVVGPDTRNAITTPASFTLSDATDWFSGDMVNLKVWTRALSASDVAAELASYTVVNSTSLVRAHNFKTVTMVPDAGPGANATAGSTATTQVVGPHLLDDQALAGLTGIATAEAFGTAVVKQAVVATGIASVGAFGALTVSAFPHVKQYAWDFTPGGQTVIGSTFSEQQATAGNLIAICVSAHKDIGTYTLSGTGWHYPVNLRSSFFSLVLAWKVAAGGEFTVSGTITSGNEIGANALVVELEDGRSGQWAEMGVATNNTDGSNIANVSSGTTGASTGAGLALAVFGVDNILSDSVDTFSNGYTTLFSQASGQFESGLWVADHTVLAGSTAESTLTRSAPVTARKMSGGLAILGRAPTQNLAPSGVVTAEAFGTLEIPIPPSPLGIASTEAFGTAVVVIQPFNLRVVSIDSAEAFGGLVVHDGPVLQLTGIASREAFGTAIVAYPARLVFLGVLNPTAIRVGDDLIDAIYAGDELLWT